MPTSKAADLDDFICFLPFFFYGPYSNVECLFFSLFVYYFVNDLLLVTNA